MLDILLLISCMALLTLALGLPLLVKPDSLIPDVVGFGILAVVALGFAWAMGDWWIFLPILAIVGFAAWLDRGDRPASTDGSCGTIGWSDRTRARFRLWRAANLLQLILIVCVLTFVATGFSLAAVKPIASWMLVGMVATTAFRFSFHRSRRHDVGTLSNYGGALAPARGGAAFHP